jgi:hypothetical protein
MLTIVGGRFGLDYTVSLNAPGSAGVTLLNQSVAAILYSGLEAASFAGAVIRPLSGAAVLISRANGSYFGQVSFVDSIIEYPENASECIAFDTLHSLYLSNVYLSNCENIVAGIRANASGWALVHELAVGVDIPTPSRSCKTVRMPTYVDGAILSAALVNVSVSGLCCRVAMSRLTCCSGVSPPSAEVTEQHKWDESQYPTFDEEGVFNARDYGATGA